MRLGFDKLPFFMRSWAWLVTYRLVTFFIIMIIGIILGYIYGV